MAKQLYDYWFVQFDFPNEEGKPYKASGGAMVWNEKLKREIPQGWHCGTLLDIAEYTNGLACQKYRPTDNNKLPVIKIKEMHDGLSADTEWVKADIPDDVKVFDGDVLFSWSASLEVMLWAYGNGGLNQHIFKVTSKNGYPRSFYFYQLIHYVGVFKQIAEARKTTMGHITQDHLRQSTIVLPPNIDVANKLEEKLCPIFDAIIKNNQEIMALTKQRDELLPLLMNGQASVNYHLCGFQSFRILYGKPKRRIEMKENIVKDIVNCMRELLTQEQLECLGVVVRKALSACEVVEVSGAELQQGKDNAALLDVFISAKKIEGCSEKTLQYYKSSIEKLVMAVGKNVCETNTNDIRCYLAELQEKRGLSKVTMDNLRRIYSSFFSWLEDEDYITKSPVRRIHKVRTDALVKEVLSDENIEVLRDSCHEFRDIAMIDLLFSTGMRVGELVRINREDIDLHERQCVVFGKGNKEREVYFNARAKIHLKKYLEQRTDDNPALFVSLKSPYNRLTINGVEVRLRKLGAQANIATKVHPHKFRRTLATMAIDKGMPIEQVQKMLGHVKIDTTMHYAMVNQANVKIAHRKFIN